MEPTIQADLYSKLKMRTCEVVLVGGNKSHLYINLINDSSGQPIITDYEDVFILTFNRGRNTHQYTVRYDGGTFLEKHNLHVSSLEILDVNDETEYRREKREGVSLKTLCWNEFGMHDGTILDISHSGIRLETESVSLEGSYFFCFSHEHKQCIRKYMVMWQKKKYNGYEYGLSRVFID